MQYYLSLGSNLGEREQHLLQAVQYIEQQIGPVLRRSSFYYSEPWGFESEHQFCNICCLLETDKAPLEVLRLTQAIERALGRTKKSVSPKDGLSVQRSVSATVCQSQTVYHDRPIDIDLIRVFDEEGREINEQIIDDRMVNVLTIPHPLWQDRDFVKIPLREILP